MSTRVCLDGHPVLEGKQFCENGHQRAISLKCSVNNCDFKTEPVAKTEMTLAIELLKLHMKGAHNSEEVSAKTIDNVKAKDKNEEFTCHICSKMFITRVNVRRHIKLEHDRVGRFNCNNCEKTFGSKIGLRYHEASCHSLEDKCEFKCKSCPEIFSTQKKLIRHRISHQKVNYSCKVCQKVIKGKNHMNRHMREVHNVERRINTAKLDVNSYPFKCNKCEFVAKRSEHLKVHNKAKHEDFEAVRFDCLFCDKKFLYSSTLKRHNKKHH